MPNPVAEVVERLRTMARVGGHGFEKLCASAADLLERLSRERDTGVPEGWQLVPKEPTEDQIDEADYRRPLPEQYLREVYAAMLSAAPQPPTVSGLPEGASSDLPDEIYVERDADTNEKRWYSCKGMGEKYVHARLLDNWKFVAKHGLAKVTPEHTWAQWLAEMKADLSTLTRERDRAREALAKCEDLIFWLENGHERIQAGLDWQKAHPNATAAEKVAYGATWRPTADRMHREIDEIVARVKARSVLHPENPTGE